jgi:hypothetical protein
MAMTANKKQFLITVMAGITTLAVWELYLKPKTLVQEPEPASSFDFWPF